jgi:hypothetical protein
VGDLLDNPDYWRKRAEEIRAIAEGLNDPEAKFMMLRVADTYETMATRAEQRAWPKAEDSNEQ